MRGRVANPSKPTARRVERRYLCHGVSMNGQVRVLVAVEVFHQTRWHNGWFIIEYR